MDKVRDRRTTLTRRDECTCECGSHFPCFPKPPFRKLLALTLEISPVLQLFRLWIKFCYYYLLQSQFIRTAQLRNFVRARTTKDLLLIPVHIRYAAALADCFFSAGYCLLKNTVANCSIQICVVQQCFTSVSVNLLHHHVKAKFCFVQLYCSTLHNTFLTDQEYVIREKCCATQKYEKSFRLAIAADWHYIFQ